MVGGRSDGRRPVLHRGRRTPGPPRPALTEGERWTRGALADLRARSFTPLAWAAFLGASFRRSWDDARARPRLAVQAGAVALAGTAGWAIAAGAVDGAAWGLAWWLAVAAMLLTHLGMVEGPGGEPRAGLGAPNLLTLLRAALVPIPALVLGAPEVAVAVLAVAFATDAADGALARARAAETRLGAQADAAVDIGLVLVAAWAFSGAGWLPLWIAAAVTVRYALPTLLAAVHYFARAAAPPAAVFVHGRVPGVAVAAGLLALPVSGLRTAGGVLLLAGAAGGAVTAGVSAVRSYRHAPA